MSAFDKSSLGSQEGSTSDGSSGFPMIDALDIRNFRCFERLEVSNCKRFNVIVGDNGSGKTSLLEAIFLALGGTSELALRFRQQRAIDTAVGGSPRVLQESIFGELFNNANYSNPVKVKLIGDGRSARSVEVTPLSDIPKIVDLHPESIEPNVSAISAIAVGLNFVWRSGNGSERAVPFMVGPNNSFSFGNTGEYLEEFYYITSNANISSTENAYRFSDLSKKYEADEFIAHFRKIFPLIQFLNIETSGTAPAIHAKIENANRRLPLASVSGAINRLVGILLAIATGRNGVVLVDEMENGVFYKHYDKTWRIVLDFARLYNCQIFTTTHSHEWLMALVDAAEDKLDDIALWRMERTDHGPELRQYSGKTFAAGIESGGELR